MGVLRLFTSLKNFLPACIDTHGVCSNVRKYHGEIIVFEENSEFYQLQVLEDGEYKPFKIDQNSIITATDNAYDEGVELLSSNCNGSITLKSNNHAVDDLVVLVYGRELLSARQYRLAMCGKFIVQKKWRKVLWKRLLNCGRKCYAKKETN